ncbi:polysaccharide deacetylase family protein [Enterococcus timonensis]|uniref:polysaccharide deacetylase family protein n=1 Tax=Enterococcus timonensis TaxID=1852364 RepID=UPI001F2A2494|nr:polysaccharide deacetylase family protein [Enterococcus timonensis]
MFQVQQFCITYPEGKFKALTLSYDDGRTEDRRLVEIFNRYGLKGTFHLNSGLFPENLPEGQKEIYGARIPASEVKQLYAGHEVASHTYTHPTIARCPIDKVIPEVLEDRRFLENLVGYPVQGLSYPNGSYTEEIKEILPKLEIEYSRVVGSSHNFSLPKDWYQWQATCHHNQRLLEHGQEFVDLHKSQYLYLMYVWGHSFEFGRDDNFELMEKFGQLVGGRKDTWYCTNLEFKRYMDASARLVFTVDGQQVYNPTNLDIWINIDGTVQKIAPGQNKLD